MKRLGLTLCALTFAACFNYDYASSVCHDAGGCRVPEDAGAGDAGQTDAGLADAGPADAGADGGADAGDPDAGFFTSPPPQFMTRTGWGWEFPFPGGPSLRSVAAVNDDEAWATGEDDSILHFVDGGLFFSRVVPAPEATMEGQQVVGLGDGGLMMTGARYYVRVANGWASSGVFPFLAATAELGFEGVPWFGVQSPGACATGAAVVEGAGIPFRPFCLAPDAGAGATIGLDPRGWALTQSGVVARRTSLADGGLAWAPFGLAPRWESGDVLGLTGDEVLAVGASDGGARVLFPDGGFEAVTVDPLLDAPEDWRTLVRTADQQGFYVGGPSGVFRCGASRPIDCVREWADPSLSLQTLRHGPTAVFGVGDNGQLVRRNADAGWETLHEGGFGSLTDVWVDPNGELWVTATRGRLLHRTAAGWQRVQLPAGQEDDLWSLTRTSDGKLWVVGSHTLASYDPGSNTLTPAEIVMSDGGPFVVDGASRNLGSISGTEPGNTWAVGQKSLVGYGVDGSWRAFPLPAGAEHLRDVWASDAGTAWAVGGYLTKLVLFWDGTQWLDRTPTGPGDYFCVWGPNGAEAFVAGDPNSGYHFHADGGVTRWTSEWLTSLTGAVTDAGMLVFAGHQGFVWRSVNGAPPVALPATNAGGRYLNRIRLVGAKVFAVGAGPNDERSFLLSYDAGL